MAPALCNEVIKSSGRSVRLNTLCYQALDASENSELHLKLLEEFRKLHILRLFLIRLFFCCNRICSCKGSVLWSQIAISLGANGHIPKNMTFVNGALNPFASLRIRQSNSKINFAMVAFSSFIV